MVLTPEGLAQPCRTRNANRIFGCWRRSSSWCGTASERSLRGPMKPRMIFGTCFEPIFSITCPLPKEELDFVVDRLNTTFARAAPKCCAIGLTVLIAVGVLTCVVGILWDTVLFNVGMPGVGVALFGALLILLGCFGAQCSSAVLLKALTAIRRELSEINAQYNARGIDLQLIEWSEFVLTGYGPQTAGYGRQMAVRQVWKHALVIRALQPEQAGFAPSEPQRLQEPQGL